MRELTPPILLDTMETYFDSRLDLIQRSLAKHSDRLKMKADQAFQGVLKKDVLKQMRSPSGEALADNFEREMHKFKLKVCCHVYRLPHLTR